MQAAPVLVLSPRRPSRNRIAAIAFAPAGTATNEVSYAGGTIPAGSYEFHVELSAFRTQPIVNSQTFASAFAAAVRQVYGLNVAGAAASARISNLNATAPFNPQGSVTDELMDPRTDTGPTWRVGISGTMNSPSTITVKGLDGLNNALAIALSTATTLGQSTAPDRVVRNGHANTFFVADSNVLYRPNAATAQSLIRQLLDDPQACNGAVNYIAMWLRGCLTVTRVIVTTPTQPRVYVSPTIDVPIAAEPPTTQPAPYADSYNANVRATQPATWNRSVALWNARSDYYHSPRTALTASGLQQFQEGYLSRLPTHPQWEPQAITVDGALNPGTVQALETVYGSLMPRTTATPTTTGQNSITPIPAPSSTGGTGGCTAQIASAAWIRPTATFDHVGPQVPANTHLLVIGRTARVQGSLTLYKVQVADGSQRGLMGFAALDAADLRRVNDPGCVARLPLVAVVTTGVSTTTARPSTTGATGTGGTTTHTTAQPSTAHSGTTGTATGASGTETGAGTADSMGGTGGTSSGDGGLTTRQVVGIGLLGAGAVGVAWLAKNGKFRKFW